MPSHRYRGGAPALCAAHQDVLVRASEWASLSALFSTPVDILELDIVNDLVTWRLLERSGDRYRRVPQTVSNDRPLVPGAP